jgi:hypothetical protein
MAALSRTRWQGDSRCFDLPAFAGSLCLDQFVANSAQSPITLVAPRIESLLLCGEPYGATGFAQVTTV